MGLRDSGAHVRCQEGSALLRRRKKDGQRERERERESEREHGRKMLDGKEEGRNK